MLIRMTTHRPLVDKQGRDVLAYPGLEIELSTEQAVRLLASGQAESVKAESERAVEPPTEEAVVDPPAKPAKKGR